MPQRYVHNSEPLHMFNRNKKNTVPSEQFRRKVCRLPKKAITLKGAMTFRNIEFSKVFSHMLILANFHKVTTSTHDPSALPPPMRKCTSTRHLADVPASRFGLLVHGRDMEKGRVIFPDT